MNMFRPCAIEHSMEHSMEHSTEQSMEHSTEHAMNMFRPCAIDRSMELYRHRRQDYVGIADGMCSARARQRLDERLSDEGAVRLERTFDGPFDGTFAATFG